MIAVHREAGGRTGDTAFVLALALPLLPKADAFACAAAAHHSPRRKYRLSSSTMALITSYLVVLQRRPSSRCSATWTAWLRAARMLRSAGEQSSAGGRSATRCSPPLESTSIGTPSWSARCRTGEALPFCCVPLPFFPETVPFLATLLHRFALFFPAVQRKPGHSGSLSAAPIKYRLSSSTMALITSYPISSAN